MDSSLRNPPVNIAHVPNGTYEVVGAVMGRGSAQVVAKVSSMCNRQRVCHVLMDAIAPIGVVIATGMEDGQHLVRVASDEVGPCSATCVVLAEDDDMIE